MSAFLQSGRSDHQILSEIKVRFRPEAVIRVQRKTPPKRGSQRYKTDSLSIAIIVHVKRNDSDGLGSVGVAPEVS